MGPTSPRALARQMSALSFHRLTCHWRSFSEVTALCNRVPWSQALVLQVVMAYPKVGGTWKVIELIKKSKTTRKSTCHWFTLFKVPSWIHTLSFSKGKFTKTVNTKQSVTASSLYTMNFTSLSILGFCHKPTAHLSLQSTTTWNQWSLQRTTGQAGLYRKIEIPLNQCHNHPNLNLYPGASEIHCHASSPQSMRLLTQYWRWQEWF